MLDIIRNFAVKKKKKKNGTFEHLAIKVTSNNKDGDAASKLLQIDQSNHHFEKLKEQQQNSADTPSISVGVNQDCIERNRLIKKVEVVAHKSW